MEGVNTLAYYDTATIMSVKSFIVDAPGACIIKLIKAVIYSFRNKLERPYHLTRLESIARDKHSSLLRKP
jgi:hypothetical protein